MTNFELYAQGALANGAAWSSRIYATGAVAEATAATAIHTAWGDLWGDITTYMPVASTVTLTAAVTLNAAWKFGTRTPTTEVLVGTSGSESMPIRTSPVITWKTAVAAKGKQGRAFLPAAAVNGIATAADTGLLLPAFITALSTGATAFLGALTAAGLTPLLLDRKDLSQVTINGNKIANKFRTQKRRDDKTVTTYV